MFTEIAEKLKKYIDPTNINYKKEDGMIVITPKSLEFVQTLIGDLLNEIDRVEEEKNSINKSLLNNRKPYYFSPSFSMRFICGWDSEDIFKMVFWNGGCNNSHGDLAEHYSINNNDKLNNIKGGFYLPTNHNDFKSDKVILFGRSDSYGGLTDKHIEEIKKLNSNYEYIGDCLNSHPLIKKNLNN